MAKTRGQILEERQRLRAAYGQLYQDLADLLFRLDPIGINFENNSDEYEPEVGTILPRLQACQSEEDALNVVHEEFVRWFDAATAGTKGHYRKIGTEVWELWTKSVKDKGSQREGHGK
ncbi:MAG TPA: hypothetical protein VMH00_05675 [Candidatus Limnocylindrales bacterium]|nr:hypothetical protein [Candidatus Limnocylindrales bacterium]